MADNSAAYAFRFPNSQPQGPPAPQQPRGGGKTPAQTQQPALTDDLLQTGVDGYKAYYDAFATMNNFGQEMMAKFGIDVKSPSPSNPEAIDAYRTYNQLYNRTAELGNRLAVGQKTQEAMNKAALEGKIFLPARFKDGKITSSGKPMEALPAGQEEQVTGFNDILNKTKIVSDSQLQDFETLREGIVDYFQEDYYESLVGAGYDPDYAKAYIDDQVSQLMKPNVDEQAKQLQGYRWAEHNRLKKSGEGKTPIIADRYRLLKETIDGLRQGIQTEGLGAISSGYYGGKRVWDAKAKPGVSQEFIDNIPDKIKKMFPDYNWSNLLPALKLGIQGGTKEGAAQVQDEFVDPNNPQIWTQLNNMINSAPGQDKVPTEDLLMFMQETGGQQPAQQGKREQQYPVVTTQEQYEALQPGEKYMYDGEEYTKE